MRCQAEGSRKGGKTPEMGGKEGAGRRRRRGRGAAGGKTGRGLIEKKEGRALQGSIHCLRVFGTASTKFRVTVVLSKDKNSIMFRRMKTAFGGHLTKALI